MKIVVVGCGRYASKVHIPYVAKSDHAQLVGTVDPEPVVDVAKLSCSHLSDPSKTQTFLKSVNADGVIISTPPSERHQLYDAVFGEPYHIHIDKPFLAPKPTEAGFAEKHRHYWQRAEKHPLPVSIHSQRRYDSYIDKCREAIVNTKHKSGVIPYRLTYEGHDGNFRTNQEWATDTYHGLQNQLGIIAHSYYHYTDTVSYLLRSIDVKTVTSEITIKRQHDITRTNSLEEKSLLQTCSNGAASGPISVTAHHKMTAVSGQTINVTIHVSHQGATRRTGSVSNQYTQNRYSTKKLALHAGSLLSASYTSRPVSLERPTTKTDVLRLDDALTQKTSRYSRQRKNRLDAKRINCLKDFVKGYEEGTMNRSSIKQHGLTQSLYLQAAKHAMQADHRSCS